MERPTIHKKDEYKDIAKSNKSANLWDNFYKKQSDEYGKYYFTKLCFDIEFIITGDVFSKNELRTLIYIYSQCSRYKKIAIATKKEIKDYLNISYHNLKVAMDKLIDKNVISVDEDGYIILNLDVNNWYIYEDNKHLSVSNQGNQPEKERVVPSTTKEQPKKQEIQIESENKELSEDEQLQAELDSL